MIWIDFFVSAIALCMLVPTSILVVECWAALFLKDCSGACSITYRPSVAVLVPAHNEASNIRATLESLLPQLTEGDRLMVIADNCTDNTAEIARNSGAMVIERCDPNFRGKGYALDYGLQQLEANPPEVVVSMDADCLVDSEAVSKLASLAATSGRPIQGTYVMDRPAPLTARDALSMLAIRLKNFVRPRGLMKLGLPSLLAGSGMAFPWSVLRQVSLANSKTVDDIQLSVDLAIAGYSPQYCPEAEITGRLMQCNAARSQRTRWEHGHLETIFTQVPCLIREAWCQRRWDLLAIALDLCVPPLSLLVLVWSAMAIVEVVVVFLSGLGTSGILLSLEGSILVLVVFGSWVKFHRREIPGKMLLAIPLYLIWKIPIYFTFVIKPQIQWIRTER